MNTKLLYAVLLGCMLIGCTNGVNQTTDNDMKQTLTEEWDKVFPLSDKVNHRKVTFETQYGLTLAADLYTPAASEQLKDKNGKLPAIAVSGPFGATTAGASSAHRHTPTAVSSITSTRYAQPYS